MQIPLPGVAIHEKQNTDSSYFPFPDLDIYDTNQIKPTFRDVLPKVYNKTFEQSQESSDDEKPSTKTATTENPLAKLLDQLYGSYNWRQLLEQSGGNRPISTTSIPFLSGTQETVTEKLVVQNGFFGTEISGNRYNNLFGKENVVTEKPNHLHKTNSSKFMMKIVGSRLHAPTDSQNEKPESPGNQLWSFQLQTDVGAPSSFMNAQTGGQITMKPPTMRITQSPLFNIGAVGEFDPNQANTINRVQTDYLNSGSNNFNPSQINNDQHLFRPNSAFNSFITQTGSDPSNQHLPVSYDPDAVNERYMPENANNGHQHNPVVAGVTDYGMEQLGYRFSAYTDAHLQAFDASALNQEMMQSSRSMQQHPMGPMFLPPSQIKHPAENSYPSATHIGGKKDPPVVQKYNTTPQLSTVQRHMPQFTTTPPQSFNFIPGNLFPGQSIPSAGQQIVGIAQEASPPEFLRRIPLDTGNSVFNPNVINAAQAVYNPNALSWIRTRDIASGEELYAEKAEDDLNNATTLAVSSPSSPTADVLSSTITSVENNSTTSSVTNENHVQNTENDNNAETYAGTGFDPNVLNSNQGQNEFIPGQISPSFNGYMSNPYRQGQRHPYESIQNAFNPKSSGSGGAKMSFNIEQLLGMKVGSTETGNKGGNGHEVASFNPNTVNSMVAMPFANNGGNSSGDMGGFGVEFTGTAFDPNAANQGFANSLGVSQGNAVSNESFGYMGGYSGFDPNEANVGFGKGGFGIDGTDTSGGGGYMAAFDPNKVNQMAIQNPFKQGLNTTVESNMFGSLVGMFSGVGQAQSNSYTSPYISAFNPDSVNQASYDPNKYNQVHLHLDPLDMLINNPGMDKDTLKAAASAFDPDKLNNPNMHQALSPMEMLSANPGVDTNVLSNLKYDPYADTGSSFNKILSVSASSSNSFGQNVTSSRIFDPIALMAKLMQGSGAFQPGTVGRGQQSLDPSSMFGNTNPITKEAVQPTLIPSTSVQEQITLSTQTPSNLSEMPQLLTPPAVSLTSMMEVTSTSSSNVTEA